MKTRGPFLLLSLILCASVALDACSGSPEDITLATGGNGSGGRNSSGSSSGIDPDALSKNCAGLVVVDAASCTKDDLVCRNSGGDLCLCGGLDPGGPQVWDCSMIGTPPSSTGGSASGGAGGEPQNNGGEGGVPISNPSSGGQETSPGGDANAGATS